MSPSVSKCLQMSPICLQMSPKCLQNVSKCLQNVSKCLQNVLIETFPPIGYTNLKFLTSSLVLAPNLKMPTRSLIRLVFSARVWNYNSANNFFCIPEIYALKKCKTLANFWNMEIEQIMLVLVILVQKLEQTHKKILVLF